MVEERRDDMLAAMHECSSEVPKSEDVVTEQNPILENSQATVAPCKICGGRVRVKEIHVAGYGDTDELECLKCGNLCYASRDSVTSVEDQVNISSAAIDSVPVATSIEGEKEVHGPRESERPSETQASFSSLQIKPEVEEANTPSESHYDQGSPPQQSSKLPSVEPSSVEMIASLLQSASTGDVDEVKRILDEGLAEVDESDYDGRTALHLAASEGHHGVVKLLLERNAKVNPVDRWGDTPLQDAMRYVRGDKAKQVEYQRVQRSLAKRGRGQGLNQAEDEEGLGTEQKEKLEQEGQMEQLREEYEIEPDELQDLDTAKIIGQGSYGVVRKVKWRGTDVAAKMILQKLAEREEINELPDRTSGMSYDRKEFRMELLLLHSLRHPNIVEFLGAVTESDNFIIVTEYLPNGDLHEIIQRRGRIPARDAVNYALDIARGMNYLHQHKPKAIVHRDLKPRNLLQDAAGHLKVADFGLSKLLEPRPRKSKNDAYNMTGGTGTYRYMAPEVYLGQNYNQSVDVFSFAIIVQEMFEGGQTLLSSPGQEVAQARAQSGKRPAFFARTYPPRMKEWLWFHRIHGPNYQRLRHLRASIPVSCKAFGSRRLLRECWDDVPEKRPTFENIIHRLVFMQKELKAMSRWKPKPMFTGAVSNISATLSRWVQQRLPLDERGLESRRGDRSHRGGGSSPPSEDTNSSWSLGGSSLPPSSFGNSSGSIRGSNLPPQHPTMSSPSSPARRKSFASFTRRQSPPD